eukprot:1195548-Prorocentrum_minimum.AAC.5
MSPAMPPAMRCYSAVGEGARAGRCAGTLRRAYPTREFLLGPSVLGHRLDSDYLQTFVCFVYHVYVVVCSYIRHECCSISRLSTLRRRLAYILHVFDSM